MRKAGLALGLPRPRGHAHPLQLALQRPPPGRLLLLLLGQPVLLLVQPGRVVALPRDARAAVQLQDPARHVVQEVAVVGHGHHRALVVLQEPLQPSHGLRVEVVGGLVEQQHVAGLEQQAAERDPPALAAGKRGHLRLARRHPQRVHGHLEVPVQLPQVLGVDLVLEAAQLVGVLLGPIGRQLLVPLHDRALRGDRLLHGLQHGLARVELRLLGQVADAGPCRGEGLAREVLVDPGHDPQQRALARPVGAQHADLRPRVEGQPDPAQDLLPLRRDLAQVLHGEDELGRHGFKIVPRNAEPGSRGVIHAP